MGCRIEGCPGKRRTTILLASGAVALGLGVLVYALDRAPGTASFLPPAMTAGTGAFGPLAGSLPTFLHTMAFALITAALLAPTRRAGLAACAAWATVNIAFEVSQHTAFGDVTGFGMHGTYDSFDLLAAVLGAGTAYLLIRVVSLRAPPDAERLPA